jgi:hypothetical protein
MTQRILALEYPLGRSRHMMLDPANRNSKQDEPAGATLGATIVFSPMDY